MEIYKNSEISVQELKKLIDLDSDIQIVDIRDDSERKLVSLRNTINIKLSDLANGYNKLDFNKNIFVMCHTGVRSQIAVKWLKSKGCNYAVNVLGGIDAWAALVDTTLRRY
tara:strand:+ start:1412 stop:1744 length:333 start_codon:yes stop_codon:yes gene_type:complete